MKKCIIVGLPDAGKSTYLGAFWAIEKDGNTGHKLVCSKYPEDSVYLDTLKTRWKRQKAVDHTSLQNEKEIVFELEEFGTSNSITLCVPDFKGERFLGIIQNNIDKEVDKWFKDSDSVLFFVKFTERDTLQDELPLASPGESKELPSVLTAMTMSAWSKNIMLIKYILETYNIKRFAICISAWDKADTEQFPTVESWLKVTSPFFLNFIKENIEEYKLYGVSAQGVDYDDYQDGETIESIQQKTEENKRAYVFEKKRSYDITEPLHYLISE